MRGARRGEEKMLREEEMKKTRMSRIEQWWVGGRRERNRECNPLD